jgi:hypothetical protein
MGTDLEKAGGKPVGFDLNYVLDKGQTARPELAAKVVEPKSGRGWLPSRPSGPARCGQRRPDS